MMKQGPICATESVTIAGHAVKLCAIIVHSLGAQFPSVAGSPMFVYVILATKSHHFYKGNYTQQ